MGRDEPDVQATGELAELASRRDAGQFLPEGRLARLWKMVWRSAYTARAADVLGDVLQQEEVAGRIFVRPKQRTDDLIGGIIDR